MKTLTLSPKKTLHGEITSPADKSISHRALMFACLANGTSSIRNLLFAADPLSTMSCMQSLGVDIKVQKNDIFVKGNGLILKEPFDVLNCGNSGTTVRLLSGILAGNDFTSCLTGDNSLRQRPMARVVDPLKHMGANILGRSNGKYLPLCIKGGALHPISYTLPMASAQVKSCLILASLYTQGVCTITEPSKSRDHTERMLTAMGADIEVSGLTIKVSGYSSLYPIDITVPGDFSSAAFFIASALITKNSEILIKNVCINPTRTGLLDVIHDMGASVQIINEKMVSGEPVGDLLCKSCTSLKGVCISGDIIARMIDEFPILCIIAAVAEGVTEIRGAEELRLKETDRITAMAEGLSKMGVKTTVFPDGIAIEGRGHFDSATVNSFDDHRIAMSMAVASLVADGDITIINPDCVEISFPHFYNILQSLCRG